MSVTVMEGVRVCCVDGCNRLRFKTYARCLDHCREQWRGYARINPSERRHKRPHWDFPNLLLAIQLAAAYMSGYRHGTGDRAAGLFLAREDARKDREYMAYMQRVRP